MLQHILPADVDDKGDSRLECRDICEVLFGAYADVCPAWCQRFEKHRNHVLVSGFVGQKVIGWEIAFRLRETGNQLPEVLVGQNVGQGFWGWRWRTATIK